VKGSKMKIIVLHEKYGNRYILWDKGREEEIMKKIVSERFVEWPDYCSELEFSRIKSFYRYMQSRRHHEYENWNIMEVEDI
jgi:hypothetical protein